MKILTENEKGIVSKYPRSSLWRRSDYRMMKNLHSFVHDGKFTTRSIQYL